MASTHMQDFDSHIGVDEYASLLRCYAPPTGTELLTF